MTEANFRESYIVREQDNNNLSLRPQSFLQRLRSLGRDYLYAGIILTGFVGAVAANSAGNSILAGIGISITVLGAGLLYCDGNWRQIAPL